MTAALAGRQPARPRQAVILAGGRGERMRPFTDHEPKHMYPFHGRPFAHWLVEELRGQGFERVLFLLGYRAEATQSYFQDGRRLGLEISYATTPAEWESAPRLRHALPLLDPEFLLCYCDNIWPLRLLGLWQQWQRSGAAAQITVYENSDGYTRSNVQVAEDRVVKYDAARTAEGLAGVDIGYALISRGAVAALAEDGDNLSVAAALYPKLAAAGQLGAFTTRHRYYGVGSAARVAATEEFLARRPAVLVDRDGVLNQRAPVGRYIRSWEEWEWLPGSLDALVRFHRAGYRVAIVTNQAGIARGAVSEEAVAAIHARLADDVRAAGGEIDAIYTCPHHWDAGCACRKPQPGMLFQAQRDLHLDLTRTWFLGDDERDAQAAEAAGCLFAMVSERTPLSSYASLWLTQKERETCVSS